MKRKNKQKIHVCDHPGCDYETYLSSNLVYHTRTHTGLKPFACSIPGCDYKAAAPGDLVRHMRTHTGIKPYSCKFPGCEYKANRSWHIVRHTRIHTGEMPFSCKITGCDYKASQSGALEYHMNSHHGLKPFACNFQGCDFKAATSSHLKRHMSTHTIEGQIRRKTQENRVSKLLKEWGYTADPEVTINASKNKCVDDTQRYYSRLDFTIVNCVKAILILEVDEDQHMWYNISCEFSRMSDVRTSLLTAGYELPIYWIRYNPNGKYNVGSRKLDTCRHDRELCLRSKLEELCAPDYVPQNQVNIHYMFYDLISEKVGPQIMTDDAFPEALQKCVTWCI